MAAQQQFPMSKADTSRPAAASGGDGGAGAAAPPATTAPPKATPDEQAVAIRMGQFEKLLRARTDQFAAALPKHVTVDHFLRCTLTYAIRNPDVLACATDTIIKSLYDASQMGLAPDGRLGSGYLVPFYNKKTKRKECQFMPGYRGMIDLARRSGDIARIHAHVVYQGDEFRVELGDTPRLIHVPTGEHGEIIASYAVATFSSGEKQFEVCSRADLDKIHAASESGMSEFSPWQKWPEEQARKSAVKRLCKYLPLSPELALAIEKDNEVEVGETPIRDVEIERPRPKGSRMAALAEAIDEADAPSPEPEADPPREPGED